MCARQATLAFRLLGLALLLALFVSAAFGAAVSLPGLDGGQLAGEDLERGAVIVVFWASWSPRGKDLVERVNHLQSRFGERARVVAVNFQESEGEVRGFLARGRLAVPVFLDRDGELAKRHRVANLPAVVAFSAGDEVFRGRLGEDIDGGLAAALP